MKKRVSAVRFAKNKILLYVWVIIGLLSKTNQGFSQNVGISSNAGFIPDASAALDISYTNKGLLIPRVALSATNLVGPISLPAVSLLVYNTVTAGAGANMVTPGYYYWNGSLWISLITSTSCWLLNGNTGTTSGANFLGTTDNASLSFRTNNVPRFLIDSLGSVAVGTVPIFATGTAKDKFLVDAGSTSSNPTPTGAINLITGKGYLDNYLQLNIQNNAGTAAASSDIVASNNAATETSNFINMGINSSGNTSSGVLGGSNTAYLYATGSDVAIGNGTVGKNLIFFTGGTGSTERMRIDGNGYVGIGSNNSSLGSDLTIYQNPNIVTTRGLRLTGNAVAGISSGSGAIITLGYNIVNNKHLWFGDPDYLGNATSTFVRYSTTSGNTVLDAIAGDNSLRKPIAIGVAGDANSTVILGNDGSSVPSGSYVWANGNMAIGNSYRTNNAPINGLLVQGNVGIGTTSAANKLTVAGNVVPSADNSYNLGTSSLHWNYVYSSNILQISDRRMKTNIKNLNYGLKEVLALQPVSYNWKDKSNGENKIGLIAQDVKKVVPEVVKGDESKETLGMNYGELVPVLINAIKEQQQEIIKQQKTLDTLRVRISNYRK